MKVNTDGVLLGAWMSIPEGAVRLLDIGAGTGVISLVAAQRRSAVQDHFLIDSVEIERDSYEESLYNFNSSPWSDHLSCFHTSIQSFCGESSQKYDLIFTNPPYFSDSLKSPHSKKNSARHNDTLSYQDLIQSSAILLADEGIFSVIIPSEQCDLFTSIAEHFRLNLIRRCDLFYLKGGRCKRKMMEFSYKKTPLMEECLVVMDKNKYTQEYKTLMSPFYIIF